MTLLIRLNMYRLHFMHCDWLVHYLNSALQIWASFAFDSCLLCPRLQDRHLSTLKDVVVLSPEFCSLFVAKLAVYFDNIGTYLIGLLGFSRPVNRTGSTPSAEIHTIHTIGRNSHPRQKFTPSTSSAEIHTIGRNSLHPHHRQKFTTQKKGEEEPEKNRGKDRGRNDVSCSLWKLLSLVTRSKSKHCWRSIPLEVLAHLSFCRLVD